MSTTPNKDQKELYKRLSPILGISTKVTEYGDDQNKITIDILSCPDPIDKNVNFYSTLGLFNTIVDNNRYEMMMAMYEKYKFAPNILSTCAFFTIKSNWKCRIGSVFETMVEMYYPNLDMKHILFVSPYIWAEKLEDFELSGNVINFVLGIPISEKELQFKNKNGLDRLETLFEDNEIDVFNIERNSVI